MAPTADAPQQRRPRARPVAVVLALACAAAGLAACGGEAGATRRQISLIPHVPAAGETSWRWTSSCRAGPQAPGGCAAGGPAVGPAQLAGNAWNLGGDDTGGAVTMALDPKGRLAITGDIASTPPCTDAVCVAPQANTWVRGYPSVLYGIDQCNAATSPPQHADLRLPIAVSALPVSLIGTTRSATQADAVTYDVAYDLWLNPSDTTTPCRTDGTLEVMVWTGYDAASPPPDSLRVGTATVPYVVDGRADAGTRAWAVYATNVYGGGRTAPWGGTVWLVLDPARATASGTVSVDLGRALAEVGSLVEGTFGWTAFADTYWLDTIAFGIEFGPADADPYGDGPTRFAMDLTAYCLEPATTVADAAC